MAKILISDLHPVEEKVLFTELSDEEMAAIQGGNPAATLAGSAVGGAVIGGVLGGPVGAAGGFLSGAFIGAIAATIEVINT
ncbi:bacteriocin class II family protein [Nostoc sp.]